MDLTAFQELMTSLVRDDDSRLSPGDVSAAAGLVINRYSSDYQRKPVEDIEVLSGGILATPSTWQVGFSQVLKIEFPLQQNPPSYLDEDQFYVYDLPDETQQIRLVRANFGPALPGAGGVVRVTSTARHASSETFRADDYEVAACLGAAFLCDQLASLYGHSSEPTLQVDSVDHNDKGRMFARRAQDLRKRYEQRFPIQPKSHGASAVVELTTSRRTSFRRITH